MLLDVENDTGAQNLAVDLSALGVLKFCPISKSHKRFENYLKRPFQWSNFHGLEMTKD